MPFDFYFGLMMSDDSSYFFVEGIAVNHDDVATSETTDLDIGAEADNLETLRMSGTWMFFFHLYLVVKSIARDYQG